MNKEAFGVNSQAYRIIYQSKRNKREHHCQSQEHQTYVPDILIHQIDQFTLIKHLLVERALKAFSPRGGRTLLVAAGKAAWQMAYAAVAALGHVDGGVVVTKYDHIRGNIPGVDCYEAGHPVPDENGFAATGKALDLISDLSADDTVLFLLSGGGSALFEQPLLPGEELQDITRQLLACGADIVEINTIRKRLSRVKGGRFAEACAPAQVFVPFPVSWTVKMKKKQKETQDILSYHTQAAGCSDKARAKASGGRQPIEECGRTGL